MTKNILMLIVYSLLFSLISGCGQLQKTAPKSTVITVPDDFNTIQAAIDAAKPGNTVFVKAGIYTESIQFKDGVILQGQDVNSVIIQIASSPIINAVNCVSGEILSLSLRHLPDSDPNNHPTLITLNN